MTVFDLATRPIAADGVRVLAVTDAPVCEAVTDRFDGPVLGVHLGKAAQVWQRREDQRLDGLFRHGQLTVIPADCTTSCSTRAPTSFVHVHLGKGLVSRALEGARHEVTPRFRFDDAVCRELALSMWQQARDGGRAGARLYLEAAAIVLAQRLAHRLDQARPPSRPGGILSRAGLSGPTLRRVIDFMHERLADAPSIDALAAIAGISPAHFSRMFRASTGDPPHRYLNRLRMERAKALLADTAHPDRPVVEVALAVGFANPSHFAAAFRGAVGTTPGLYRRHRAR